MNQNTNQNQTKHIAINAVKWMIVLMLIRIDLQERQVSQIKSQNKVLKVQTNRFDIEI